LPGIEKKYESPDHGSGLFWLKKKESTDRPLRLIQWNAIKMNRACGVLPLRMTGKKLRGILFPLVGALGTHPCTTFSCKKIVIFHPTPELRRRTHQDAIEIFCITGEWQE